MLNRREVLKLSALAGVAALVPGSLLQASPAPKGPFRFCLNTSTISGQKPGLLQYIDIAAKAGYDGVELWINDIRDYLQKGNTIESLGAHLAAKKIKAENLISFTSWLSDDEATRKEALGQLEEEMKLMAAIGCRRVAAPPAGIEQGKMPAIEKAGERYREILALGRKYKVTPQLEFWGASGTLFNLGQALSIAAAANDPDARILPDVYHMFRGGSGFDALKLVNGRAIEVIHINDYPANKPVQDQTDADRVYPGDGAAPLKKILGDLKAMGGVKVLSLELFNRDYWKEDAFAVAKKGLDKVKKLVSEVVTG
jgi:2-keto-myo-inositol isomerase